MAPKATSNKKAGKPEVVTRKGRGAGRKTSGVQKVKPKKRRGNGSIDITQLANNEMITVGGPSNPIDIRKPTSRAPRRRKCPKFSMKDYLSCSKSRNDKPVDYASTFEPGSSAEYTWGIAISQPVRAIRTKRRHPGFRAFGLRRGKKSPLEKLMYGKYVDEIVSIRFMDFPLEIRREVYKHLLARPRAILMESDWRKVLVTASHDHSILLVSKQVSFESTQVFLEKNIFQTYIGFQDKFSTFKTGIFAEKFIPNIRNVIIECQKSSSMSPLANQIASCVNTLVTNGTALNSLTIAISALAAIPDPISSTQLQSKISDKTTFADFFEAPASRLMRVIPRLRCKILNIVIRLPGNKRALISIDLRANPINKCHNGWLGENEMSRLSTKRQLAQLKKNLNGLKKQIEGIYLDHEKAVLEGKARLLDRDEQLIDGMRLAARRFKTLHHGAAETVKAPSPATTKCVMVMPCNCRGMSDDKARCDRSTGGPFCIHQSKSIKGQKHIQT